MTRDPLEYVMNRMERAGQSDDPARDGYGPARKELLDGIAALRAERDAAILAKEEAEQKNLALAHETCDAIAYRQAIAARICRMREKLHENASQLGWLELQSMVNSSSPCRHEAIVARIEVEGVARWLHETNRIPKDFASIHFTEWDNLFPEGKEVYRDAARALCAYLRGEGK